MQHGYAPVGRHEKPGLRTMDESSILRRRGLQVGEPTCRAAVSVLLRGGVTLCRYSSDASLLLCCSFFPDFETFFFFSLCSHLAVQREQHPGM